MSNIQKLLKKTEKDKTQKKDDKKQQVQKLKKKEDEDDDMALDLQIENNDSGKQAKQKITITKFVQQQIEQPVVKEVKKVEPVRMSWVPQQGGVVQTFDLAKEEEHFVGIGEQYKPPPEKKGMANMKPLQFTQQEKKQMGQDLQGSTGSRPPMFTNKKKETEGSIQIQKTPQQIKEQQMEQTINANKARVLTKEEKQQREAERKKRQEEGIATLGLSSSERKPTFTKSSQETVQAPFKPLEKTHQQLKEQQIEAKAKQAGLMGKTLTKQQAEAKKQRAMENEAKKRQDEQLVREQMKPAEQSQGPPRFMNSKKKTDEPTFIELDQKPKE